MNYQDLLQEQGISGKLKLCGSTAEFDKTLPDDVATIVSFHPRVMKDENTAEFSDDILEISFDLKTCNFDIVAQSPKGKRRKPVLRMEHSGRVSLFVNGPWVRHLKEVVLTKAKKYERGEHC